VCALDRGVNSVALPAAQAGKITQPGRAVSCWRRTLSLGGRMCATVPLAVS
jgi:hypothetical protein